MSAWQDVRESHFLIYKILIIHSHQAYLCMVFYWICWGVLFLTGSAVAAMSNVCLTTNTVCLFSPQMLSIMFHLELMYFHSKFSTSSLNNRALFCVFWFLPFNLLIIIHIYCVYMKILLPMRCNLYDMVSPQVVYWWRPTGI